MRTSHILMLSALFTATAAFTGHADALGGQARATKAVEAKPIRQVAAPMSRAEGREAADAAVAGALVGITSEQFSGEKIQIKLDSVDMQAVSPRDRSVSGTGQLKVGMDEDWLPFRYRALYDTETQTAGGASITLGSTDSGGRRIEPTDALAQALASDARERMAREFPQQRVALDLETVRAIPAGRYQRVIASGAARFDDQQPAAKAQVEGLYDPQRKRWLRVAYELGEGANWAFHDGTAMVTPPVR